jgi:hypothetical protein
MAPKARTVMRLDLLEGIGLVHQELDGDVGGGVGKARNVINVLSADVVVICGGGGPDTASEAGHALNGGRPLILLAVPPLWREFFCSLGMGIQSASDLQECCRLIEARLTEA